ncbi:MAG TPA: citrate synthase family protein [Thermoanaerobaculia bacterium]|nr:citrate synthase family protein [Thermoanaerobaculia bacterium]
MVSESWISAIDATRLLGVSRSTLYAYVSRGFVRSEPAPGNPRERRYSREDVETLRRRAEERRHPEKAAERALHWGMPILESGITLISGGRLYYRGHDVATLARTRSVEEVASLVWTGVFDADIFGTPLHVVAGGRSAEALPFITRAQAMLPLVGARDPLAFDLRPKAVAQAGWRILNLLASVAVESSNLGETVEETLQTHWAPKSASAAPVIRAALILSADHELNVSSFTARCVASAGSNPYSVVLGGLAAIEGNKHGGISARVETLLTDLKRKGDIRKTLGERLRRGEPVDGFGHRLYPRGDPRATILLEMLGEHHPKSKELDYVRQVVSTAGKLLGEAPTIDFALAAVVRVLKLPAGSPLALFAIGRTIGWIGHAIEQYAHEAVIRPRARYAGKMP